MRFGLAVGSASLGVLFDSGSVRAEREEVVASWTRRMMVRTAETIPRWLMARRFDPFVPRGF